MSAGAAGQAPVLIVEDYEPVAELERRALVRAGLAVRVVGRIGDAVAVLKRESFSAILLDYQLPDGDPWSVVELARARTPRIPVIIVTAMGNERVAAEAVTRGVSEYVRKAGTFYEELPAVVARVTKLAEAEERLRRADALLQIIDRHARDLIATADAGGVLTYVSAASRALLGYEPEELVGTPGRDLVHPDDRTEGPAISHGSHTASVVRLRRKDGSYAWVESNSYLVRDPVVGAPVQVIVILHGVTER